MTTITIQKKRINKEDGVVILSLREYRKLSEQALPAYSLKGEAAKKFDRIVIDGLKEYGAGKTISARSLGEAIKIYAKKNSRN